MRIGTCILLFYSLVVASCSSESGSDKTTKVEKPAIQVAKKVVQQEKPRKEKINNENVRDKLLEYGRNNPETKVVFYTDKGIIKARLFKDTPLHRANFILMVKSGCFDNAIFTRVHIDFMAQAGATYDEKNSAIRNSIGSYTIPNEILPHHYHKQGALAAARRYEGNPKKRSDPYAFYFVEGSTFNKATLDKYERENNYTYSEEQRNYYRTNRGAAHIDGQHTVFGQVTEGLDVISAITHVKTDGRDWPVTDIYIRRVEVSE